MSGMDEIRVIFEEECREGLDAMESGLLSLESGNIDDIDTINTIFRAAHSIKGGSATFGYMDISAFTHVMETLMDRVRSRQMAVTPPLVQLLLQCVDCLRDMMAIMDGGDYDRERAGQLKTELEDWVNGGGHATAEAAAPAAPASAAAPAESPPASGHKATWSIRFLPQPHLLKTGNQPLVLFRALGELGELKVTSLLDALPDLDALDPEELHLGWQMELVTDAPRERIAEIFEWVEDDCELVIENTTPALAAPVPAAVAVAAADAPPSPPEQRKGADRRADDRRQTERRGGATKEAGSIRVSTDKIDALLNMVGELVITQAMLSSHARDAAMGGKGGLQERLSQLERNTRELQEAVMQIRMLPVSVTFSRFPRLVHDLSAKLGKSVELKISGEQTELDKTVLEKIGDPLVHLVRNSLDHGIESAEERKAAGKDATGLVHLSASHEGGNIVIRVRDDGAGLNTDKILAKARERGLIGPNDMPEESQIHDMIFAAGFSTADVVSDVSGRGVGMDVVRSNIREIGGRVEVVSERGKGSTFQITLPLTLAILDGQLVRVGPHVYVVPLLSIKETVRIEREQLNVVAGGNCVFRLRGEAIPVIDLREVCRIPGCAPLDASEWSLLMILESGRRSIALVVDELLEQHQVVIKSLETNFAQVAGILGATILGDGTVALILDIMGIARLGTEQHGARNLQRTGAASATGTAGRSHGARNYH